MADTIIERQAIRAALALAVASAHGQVADAIADMRDEATQLIELCMKEKDNGASDTMRQWCDNASALVERLSLDGTLPHHCALSASAAILRLRLALARTVVSNTRRTPETSTRVAKKKIIPVVQSRLTSVEGNQKVVMDFIAGHPNIRTSVLVDSLKDSFSSRTVKRCLKELSTAGLLHRMRQGDRSVSYSVDSER